MQQQFKEWLLKQTTRNGNRFSDDPGQVNGFIKDLKETIPSWNIGIRDVFEITDIDHVRSLYQRCGSNGDLKEKSSSVGNHRPKNALKWYAQFLESNISIDSSLNQNPIFTKLIEILREKSSFRLTGDDEQYRKFIKRFPKENLLNLSLEQYALGDGANDSFCWWIERGLESVIGGYRPGTSKGHLVYFLKSGSLYKNRNIEHLSDAEALKEVLKIHSLVANANLDDLRWLDDDKQIQIRAGLSTKLAMGNGRKLRLLSIYHPGQFLPISSSDHIAHFLTHLGIENLPKREHTVARSLLLKDVFLTAKELIPALTPFEFMKTLYGEELGIKPSKEAVDDEEDADDSETNSKKEHSSMSSLNQILYGPPGTGKTFNTVSKAIEILGQSTFADWQDRTPQSVKELKQAFPGQVEFGGQIDFSGRR
ncbi:MAG: hypothetical protein IE920_08425 [Thiotrichales bacterium]|nr:hypothetical protein [Thiotrichales bacterium]